MTTKSTKTFDCVEMKHRGAERIQRAISTMTREEELAYWARGTAELRERQRKLRETSGTSQAGDH